MPRFGIAGKGQNPLRYLGPNAALPPITSANRAPTEADHADSVIGTLWIVRANPVDSSSEGDVYMLTYFTTSGAQWKRIDFIGGSSGIDQIDVDRAVDPGTDPVLPKAPDGTVIINGNVVANHSMPIETVSLDANTITIDAQIGAGLSSAPADMTDAGIVSIDTSFMSVNANGWVGITEDFVATGKSGWNGSIIETADVVVSSNGSTISLSVEQDGGGDLTVVFSDGYYTWDTTPADTVTLTAGSDTSPQLNYVYFDQATKTLTANTTGFPSAEYAAIATVVCQSAASLQTEGAYKVHAWTDHIVGSNENGHIAHLNYWIRSQDATWTSGVVQTYNITTNVGTPDNVILTTTAGSVLQLHPHTFPAFSGTPTVYVINDFTTPYTTVTDLNALLTDSTGASMSGRYFSLVIWGVVSEDTTDCKLFCNLPSGSYNNSSDLVADVDNYSNYTIPPAYVGTGFLISEWKLRHQGSSGGTWTSIEEVDLRDQTPTSAGSGTGTATSQFADNAFAVFNNTDTTKIVDLDVSGVTTATTRTITIADQDIDMTPTTGDYQGSDADLTAISALATTGMLARTGAATYSTRTITAGDGISIADGDGVSGNPTITTTAIGNGAPNYVENLGIKLDSGTFSIVAADGTDLSSSNPGYMSVPSNVTPGEWIMHKLTDNYQFVDDNGTSTVAGMLWGTVTAVDWGEDMPFTMYGVGADDDLSAAIGITRSPAMTVAYASSNIGVRGSVVTTNQNSLFLLDLATGPTSPTVGDFDGNACVPLGAFRMHKTGGASNDWTVQPISDSDGIGKFHYETPFVLPAGVNGSQLGTGSVATVAGYFQETSDPNSFTVPIFTSSNVLYWIARSGLVYIIHEHNTISTNGTGTDELRPTLPATALTAHDAYVMQTTNSGTVNAYFGTVNLTSYLLAFKANGSSTSLQNGNISYDVSVHDTVRLFA